MKKYVSLPVGRNKNVDIEVLTVEEFENKYNSPFLHRFRCLGLFQSDSGLKYLVFKAFTRKFCVRLR